MGGLGPKLRVVSSGPPGVYDDLAYPSQAALSLLDNRGRERGVHVAGYVDLSLPDIGQHGLGPDPLRDSPRLRLTGSCLW